MNDRELTSISKIKDYWDRQPCNIKHSKSPVGSMEYYNEVESRKYFIEPHIPLFAEFEKYKGKKVLELGCGIGTDGINFARAGAQYIGIELSSESLKISKDRFKKFGLQGKFILGNIETLDEIISNESFDLIYSFGVLHHTPNINNALKAIRKISNFQTEIKIMLYAKNSYKQILVNEKLMQPEAQSGCPIANSYTKEEVLRIFHLNQLKITNIEQCHIFPYEIDSYKNYEYKKLPWFEFMPDNIFRALEKELGWHLLIRANPM